MQLTDKKPYTNRDRVLEAVRALHELEQPVTRDSIADHTGLRRSIVEESIKSLREAELIYCPERGVYRPMTQYAQARPVSYTRLPNGITKLEVGDELLELVPAEAREVAKALHGTHLEQVMVEQGHAAAVLAGKLALDVQRLRQKVAELQQAQAQAQEHQTDQAKLPLD